MASILRRASRLAPLLALPVVAAGCGDDGSGPSALAGSYALVEVNGKAPPAVIASIDTAGIKGDIRVTGGTLELDSRRYEMRLLGDLLVDGQVAISDTITDSGSYSASGDRVSFTSQSSGETLVGTHSGATIRLSDTDPTLGPLTIVFRK